RIRMGARGPTHGGDLSVTAALPTVELPCAVCGRDDADPVWATPDRAFAVPAVYAAVRCRACGSLYQRPRVRDEHLSACYPDHYPRPVSRRGPRRRRADRAGREGPLRRGDRVPCPRARAGSSRGRPPHARLAGARRTPDHRGPECRWARRYALRRCLGGPRAAPPSLALHAGDARARVAEGGRPNRVDLAPGEAALVLVELVGAHARSRLARARALERVAAHLRGAEARVGGVAPARAPGAAGRGDQGRRRRESPDVAKAEGDSSRVARFASPRSRCAKRLGSRFFAS